MKMIMVCISISKHEEKKESPHFSTFSHMGNAISRHRSRILIRMYNSGVHLDSLYESFQEYGETINLFDIEKVLSHTLPEYHVDLYDISIPYNERLKTSDVVSFLNTGKASMSWNEMAKEEVLVVVDEARKTDEKNVTRLKQEQSIVQHENVTTRNATAKIDFDEKQVIKAPSSSSIPSSTLQSILKRHETVINERIVRTVSFQNGIEKISIETDKTQCDKIRMESDGEFAVREYTQQEQTEELDGNMTTFVRATQEFLHLKSKEDEFEYVHSDIPTGEDDDDEYDTDDHYESEEDDDYTYY